MFLIPRGLFEKEWKSFTLRDRGTSGSREARAQGARTMTNGGRNMRGVGGGGGGAT